MVWLCVLALMLYFHRMSFHAVPVCIFELSLQKTLGIPCSSEKNHIFTVMPSDYMLDGESEL